MRIERAEIDGVAILRVTGEVDFSDTSALIGELRSLSDAGQKHVLMNLSLCKGMVSSAIGVLVGWRCETSLKGGDFWVLSPSREVRDIFDMVGVTEHLVRPEATEVQAIAALKVGQWH
ncbi:MAG: STAS domain-containing protein [Planctomycetes bacterium]|nr:STAS domain-containing protein [Planctomycetota bacterium]